MNKNEVLDNVAYHYEENPVYLKCRVKDYNFGREWHIPIPEDVRDGDVFGYVNRTIFSLRKMVNEGFNMGSKF